MASGGLIDIDINRVIRKVRFLSDNRNSEFVNEEVLREHIQDSIDDLYMMLVDSDENYFIKDLNVKRLVSVSPVNEIGGVELPAVPTSYLEEDLPQNAIKLILPDDYFKLRLLQYQYSPNLKYSFRPISLKEMSKYQSYSSGNDIGYRFNDFETNIEKYLAYIHMKRHLLVFPRSIINNSEGLRLHYTPIAPDIIERNPVDQSFVRDTVELPYGSAAYLAYYTASDIGIAENIDTQDVTNKLVYWKNIIMNSASQRDTSYPKTVADTEDGRLLY